MDHLNKWPCINWCQQLARTRTFKLKSLARLDEQIPTVRNITIKQSMQLWVQVHREAIAACEQQHAEASSKLPVQVSTKSRFSGFTNGGSARGTGAPARAMVVNVRSNDE